MQLCKDFIYIYIILFGAHYFMCVGDRLRLHHAITLASQHRRRNWHKSAHMITLFIELPYRRVRLPRGLRPHQEGPTSSGVRRWAISLLLLTLHMFPNHRHELSFDKWDHIIRRMM